MGGGGREGERLVKRSMYTDWWRANSEIDSMTNYSHAANIQLKHARKYKSQCQEICMMVVCHTPAV